MRKMKKINGFLIVRFNEREKKDYPTLGNFGIIDAETYTGDIDVDRGVLEYDDAETIEIAVEQARGLNAEVDYPDKGPAYTLVVEDGSDTTETEIEPQLLIAGWEKQLEMQIKSPHYKDVDPRTAAHELFGYKTALHELGLIDQDAQAVGFDHFAPGMVEQPLPRDSEELVAYICDQICKANSCLQPAKCDFSLDVESRWYKWYSATPSEIHYENTSNFPLAKCLSKYRVGGI